ncbi:MAG: matrixin family metalloprotease [Luteitalea sp.]|nr:matrixin family metalloprotease [Luteitalea sp.]
MIAGDAGSNALERHMIICLTALHEFGHALGLEHNADFAYIMYQFSRPGDGERYFTGYRARLQSADDIGSATATGLSAKTSPRFARCTTADIELIPNNLEAPPGFEPGTR